MDLFAFISAGNASPVMVFFAIMVGTFWLLSLISQRNMARRSGS